jgi:hypothetical protein
MALMLIGGNGWRWLEWLEVVGDSWRSWKAVGRLLEGLKIVETCWGNIGIAAKKCTQCLDKPLQNINF